MCIYAHFNKKIILGFLNTNFLKHLSDKFCSPNENQNRNECYGSLVTNKFWQWCWSHHQYPAMYLPRKLSCDISMAWSSSCWPVCGSVSAGSMSDDVLGRGLVPSDRLPDTGLSDVQPTSSSWLLELRAVRARGEELRRGLTAGLLSVGDLLLTAHTVTLHHIASSPHHIINTVSSKAWTYVLTNTSFNSADRYFESKDQTCMLSQHVCRLYCVSKYKQFPEDNWVRHNCWKPVESQASQSRCTVVRPMQKNNRKMENSTPCKIANPENIILKLCIRDYVGEMIHHANFGFNWCSGGFSPNRRNVITLWLFFLTVLSCPVLTLPFFDPAPRSNRWTDFHALWLKRRVSVQGWSFWGVRTMGDHICGKYEPNPLNGRE